jgi:hypothetical protein
MSFAQPARIPLPPVNADVNIICCEYCPVACGYKRNVGTFRRSIGAGRRLC